MTLENLAIARDWAVIVLALQALVVVALALFVAFMLNRGLRRTRPKAVSGLHRARHAVSDVSRVVRLRTVDAARPFVWVDSTRVGVRAAWAAWRRNLLGRR